MKLDERNNITARFVGVDLQDSERKKLEAKYPNIEFIPKVSQEDSFRYMLSSNVLVSIHSAIDDSSIYLIGGKLELIIIKIMQSRII